ncbi:TetR-like C-terminal domain-containing protein [Nonomuraea sp. NPDC050556]|uniref:TetR-like C-terminal domain-containing protein n=1 Tax=Nonomuraea sp. NPDC050556 TaxID=3364369 RepID=UPI0037A2277D
MSVRGRKPDPAVDRKIKEAAVGLIMAKGLDFTMDEVAAAAGVGRASVFRRYGAKRDLLLATLAELMDTQVAYPDIGSLEGDLIVVARDTFAAWEEPSIAHVAREVFGEAARDPAVAELMRTAMRNRMARAWELYDRAIARGELPEDADLWIMSDMLAGVAAYRGVLGIPLPDPAPFVRALMHGFALKRDDEQT